MRGTIATQRLLHHHQRFFLLFVQYGSENHNVSQVDIDPGLEAVVAGGETRKEEEEEERREKKATYVILLNGARRAT